MFYVGITPLRLIVNVLTTPCRWFKWLLSRVLTRARGRDADEGSAPEHYVPTAEDLEKRAARAAKRAAKEALRPKVVTFPRELTSRLEAACLRYLARKRFKAVLAAIRARPPPKAPGYYAKKLAYIRTRADSEAVVSTFAAPASPERARKIWHDLLTVPNGVPMLTQFAVDRSLLEVTEVQQGWFPPLIHPIKPIAGLFLPMGLYMVRDLQEGQTPALQPFKLPWRGELLVFITEPPTGPPPPRKFTSRLRDEKDLPPKVGGVPFATLQAIDAADSVGDGKKVNESRKGKGKAAPTSGVLGGGVRPTANSPARRLEQGVNRYSLPLRGDETDRFLEEHSGWGIGEERPVNEKDWE